MANIDNFLTQRVMISTSLKPSGVFKSPSVDLKLLRRMKGTKSPGLSGPEHPLKYSLNTVKLKQ